MEMANNIHKDQKLKNIKLKKNNKIKYVPDRNFGLQIGH